jgi:hypothetical protein
MDIFTRIKHAWNAFTNSEEENEYYGNRYSSLGETSYYNPSRYYLPYGNEASIVTPIYNRIAMDCADYILHHARVDGNGRYLEDIDSHLNRCLSLEANKDQTARAFIQEVVLSLFGEGNIAVVPIDTTINPQNSDSWDIDSFRVGKILQWYPDNVKVEVYNDRLGKRENLIVPKRNTALIENPFYAVVNEPNSVAKRLMLKLNLLDVIDQQSGSGKLDLIIQLPYVIKTELRKTQAEERRKDIENQLASSKFGIAYTDGTEHITQLNRPVENNLLTQVQYLTSMLYSQLGITTSIMDGTADANTMNNYRVRTLQPIMSAISLEMTRKFLTKTARTQNQKITYFPDVMKYIPLQTIPDFADKLTRNAIVSSNEMRQMLGMKPSNDPKADELSNKNINQPESGSPQEIQQPSGDGPATNEPQ